MSFLRLMCFACALTGLPALPTAAAELVMVEQAGCHWCEKWDEEIASIYPRTEAGQAAPLRRVDLRDLPQDIRFATRPVFTPTFVLVEEGEELARLEGYAGDEFFWYLLDEMIAESGVMPIADEAPSITEEVTQ